MNLHSNARSCPKSRLTMVERAAVFSAEQTAASFGVSPRTVHKWRARYREGGPEGLADRSSRPRTQPNRTDPEREELICRLRHCRLTGPQIAQALKMPSSTVASVLKRAGLARLRDLEPPEPVRRYERSDPGELIHVDTKKLGCIRRVGHRITKNRRDTVRGAGWEFVHVAIDDASRLAYVEVLPNEQADTTVGFLLRAMAFYRRHGLKIRQIMSDNGPAYISRVFAAACQRFRIRHLRTKPYTPQTNGKAERLIQTLLREWAYVIPYNSSRRRTAALPRWLRYYNHHRPHAGIGGLTPLARLQQLR
jgi:transposase InsO family protein